MAEMLRADLDAAGIPVETGSGVVDFHALRHTFGSMVVRSECSVKTAQELMRHSTPSLTIDRYAHASLRDIRGAMDGLPDLSPPKPDPIAEVGRSTGTDGRHIGKPFSHHLPTGGDGSGRDVAVRVGSDDVKAPTPDVLSMSRNPLQSGDLDGSSRSLSGAVGTAGSGSRTHTGVTPRRILGPLRLPLSTCWEHADSVFKLLLVREFTL